MPVLLGLPARGHRTGPPPVALWFHGFRADARANAAELARIADAGFLAVGVDAVGHGRRADPTLSSRIAMSSGGALPVMLAMADATAAEIPALLTALATRGLGDPARTALVGVSMGAFLVYRALLDVPVRAAVAILGSPEWPGARNPALADAATFRDVALLSITAQRDESVPPGPTRAFHDRLSGARTDFPRHRYLELPGAPHLVDTHGWEVIVRGTLDWLTTHVG